MKSILRAQGRLRKLAPVAIVDIGSNSVRLVVYEGLSRSPTPLFNEKVLCGLGAHIATTGMLDEKGVVRALDALRRFRLLAQQTGAEEIYTLATAAAREAGNGPAFVKAAEKALGHKVHVLTGPEEAKFAALGIVCGFAHAKGVAGDMGGGSLEFAAVDGSDLGRGVTVPLGGLRLQDESGEDLSVARKLVKAALADDTILKAAQGETFYAVGGTWRALGRLHMARRGYPLHVMHDYTIDADDAMTLCKRLMRPQGAAVRGIESVSTSRRILLPYGAAVLAQVITQMQPSKVSFSAVGVREGYLYSLLPKKIQKADALITAAEEFAVLRARSPIHARELVHWTKRVLAAMDLKECHDEKRYRKAACLLADITWRSHPDYRGDQALNIISNGNFVGVDHPGRAYLALASYFRHEGVGVGLTPPALIDVAGEHLAQRAKLLGALFRVAYQFSAAMPGVLPNVGVGAEGGALTFRLPKEFTALTGERPDKRLRGLGEVLGCEVRLETR